MKKTMSILLAVVMIFSLMAYAGVAYAETKTAGSHPAARLDADAFAQMTPQEQYDYILTLGSEDEIRLLLNGLSSEQLQQLLSTLSDEQLSAIEKYLKQGEPQAEETSAQATQSVDPGAPGTGSADPGASASDAPSNQAAPNTEDTDDTTDDTADVTDDKADDAPVVIEEEPAVGYAAMTPQELYEYLCTLNDEESEAVLSVLTPEQCAALEAYMLSLPPHDDAITPAADYMHAAPLKDPVDIVLPKTAKLMASMSAVNGIDASTVASTGQEDALMVNKTVSEKDGKYMLNIEAYATGAVTITPGQPIPADIILVLDTSLSMDTNMSTEGYTPKTYNTNGEAYNDRNNLYAKVNNQYYALTITNNGGNQSTRKYTYTYIIGTTTHTFTSTGRDVKPPIDIDFYKYTQGTISRIDALISAANNFIDSIGAKAITGIDHRIAVVTYSTNASILSGDKVTNRAFVNANDQTRINTLKTAISNLDTVEYTSADRGLNLASDIFRDDHPAVSGPRNRVVVFFTDGAPSRGDAGAYQETVANLAVTAAKTLKAPVAQAGRGATIYSIGIFDGANPSVPIVDTTVENKFMHLVSSNYPNAMSMSSYGDGGNKGYYLSTSNAGGLNTIFQAISDNIETGGTSVTLDASSVIKDMIAPYFKLPDNVNSSGIVVQTSTVDSASGLWGQPQAFAGTVIISSDRRTISVSGFSYKDNYYAVIKESGKQDRYKGTKLIIGIPIEYIPHSCIGGLVPTNLGTSAIYSKNSLGNETLVKALPIPVLPIPVDYDYAAVNRSVYLRQSLNGSDLFADTQSYYVPDKINNAYVDIVYTVKDSQNNLLGTFTIPRGADHGTWNPADPALSSLTENKTYAISCTVTPNSTSIASATINKNANVYVFRPRITYSDSTIYLGETANYSDNFIKTEWKNTVSGIPGPSGPEPVLSFSYSPAAGAFAMDTYVNTSVRIGGVDVTPYTTFVHNETIPGSGFDPLKGEFIVFVKSCALTVTKAGAADSTDTFVFTVKNENGLELTLSMQGNDSQTIVGLPVGNYTVMEKASWPWRYAADSPKVELSRAQSSGTVTVNNHVTNDKWLAGDDWAANTFNRQ